MRPPGPHAFMLLGAIGAVLNMVATVLGHADASDGTAWVVIMVVAYAWSDLRGAR
jgi:hypothetical protein